MKENKTITKAEKKLVKGFIELFLEKGYDINDIEANEIEVIMMRITGRNHEEKRDTMERFIITQLIKEGSTRY